MTTRATQPSVHPIGPPLPPNRRVGRGSRSSIVEAPEERAGLDARSETDSLVPQNQESTPPTAETTRRRVMDALRLAAGVLVTIAAALGCVWGMLRYTRTSPRFAIRNVEVTGSSHRSPEDIARLGGITRGQNVFTTDLEAAKVGILGDPWIEQASVRRKLPGAIVVEVVEREAAGLVAVGPDLYLSTRQGELFKKPESGDPYDLPVITGTRPEDIVKDRDAAVAMIKKALDLVSDYEHLGPAKHLPVQEVHIEDDGALVLSVGKDPIALRLGKGPYRQSLEQASRVLGELANRHAEASVVFLDNEAHPERVVVRMR
jgi:cell division protein FtsQ